MEHNVNIPSVDEVKNHVRSNKRVYVAFGMGVLVAFALRRPVQVINTIHVPPLR